MINASTQIRLGQVSGRGSDEIIVNGHDVTTDTAGIVVTAKVGEVTKVELDMRPRDGANFVGDAHVSLIQATRDALLSLGWTPPVGERAVRFWIYVSDEPHILDAVRENTLGWTIVRELQLAATCPVPARWLFEIEDPNMPVAADGGLVCPIFSRTYHDDGTETVSISDYGLPREVEPEPENRLRVDFVLPQGANYWDDKVQADVKAAADEMATTRGRRVVGLSDYIGASMTDGGIFARLDIRHRGPRVRKRARMTADRPEEHTAPTDPTTIRPWIDLKLTGLLWLLNSSVLHPRGFALSIVREPTSGEIVGWKLLGDGREPWKFNGIEQGSCDANFADVEAMFAAARTAAT